MIGGSMLGVMPGIMGIMGSTMVTSGGPSLLPGTVGAPPGMGSWVSLGVPPAPFCSGQAVLLGQLGMAAVLGSPLLFAEQAQATQASAAVLR
jgi:hypothetical protein